MHRASWRAFTVVEMLVVVGIVVILAALLVPVASLVRQRGRVVLCAGRLMQLGVAIGAYTNDYGNTLPLVYPMQWFGPPSETPPPSPPPTHTAEFVLHDYVPNHDAFCCPVLPMRWMWFPLGPDTWAYVDTRRYEFNPHVSGMRVPPFPHWAGPARCLTMYDQVSENVRAAHLGGLNALFLDGHVKAYHWIKAIGPARNVDWPPD